jgi:ferric-dicitrate binding protein FerR (iron transport regulator)
MSTSVPPRDGAAKTASPSSLPPTLLSDELALRRAFDLEYSGCIASARSQLGEAESHAPRIVEAAFVNAWNQRASIGTNEQLKTFLGEQVHHGASRTLSRRAAAHRFGTHGGRDEVHLASHNAASGAADAEKSWTEITRAIHDTGPTTDAHAAVATAGRHEAAEHMKVVAKKTKWGIPIAIGVVAIAVSVAAAFYLDRLGEDDAAVNSVSGAAIQPLVASNSGQIGSLSLPDGSKMRIGPETKVFVADGFPSKVRNVRVDGTAQFDVAPNQALPLRVVVKKGQVIATGTSFIVSAYSTDTGFMVMVREGSVTVKSEKLSIPLTANQTVAVRGSTSETPTEAQRTEAFGWVDGRITVADRPLRDVIAHLSRWFNLDIKVPDLKLLDRKASFSVSLDSSRQAITQVEKSGNVQFAYEGETKVFRDVTATTTKKKKK